MSNSTEGGDKPLSIEVQGVTIRVGEAVLAPIGGAWVGRQFLGVDPDGRVRVGFTDEWSARPQPPLARFPAEQLRHPSLLDGMIREIDASE